jgi:hypothetical protein
MKNQKLKDEIILELTELAKIEMVENELVAQVNAGDFDEDIEAFDESYSVSDAADSICDYYKIRKNSK